MVRIRYIVNDVEEAIKFYTENLGFKLNVQHGQAVAMLDLGELQLIVSGPMASGSKSMPDGVKVTPGGWSRFMITVDDIEAEVSRLKQNGVKFRNDIIEGPGGKQTLVLDPSENVVELHEPSDIGKIKKMKL